MSHNSIRISICSWSSIFKISIPVIIYCIDRNTNTSTPITNPIAKFLNRLCFMFTCQPLIIIRPIFFYGLLMRLSLTSHIYPHADSNDPRPRISLLEKLVCIPEPFQSPFCGFGAKLIDTPCFSAIFIRMYRAIHRSSPALMPLPKT